MPERQSESRNIRAPRLDSLTMLGFIRTNDFDIEKSCTGLCRRHLPIRSCAIDWVARIGHDVQPQSKIVRGQAISELITLVFDHSQAHISESLFDRIDAQIEGIDGFGEPLREGCLTGPRQSCKNEEPCHPQTSEFDQIALNPNGPIDWRSRDIGQNPSSIYGTILVRYTFAVPFTPQGNNLFKLSKTTDYGIVLLATLARDASSQPQNARDLASASDLPVPMVSKVLKALAKEGLLVSHRGSKGGYRLARRPEELTVAEMIRALDGPVGLTDCAIGPALCEHETMCAIRQPWQTISRVVEQALSEVTLADLARGKPGLNDPSIQDVLQIEGRDSFDSNSDSRSETHSEPDC